MLMNPSKKNIQVIKQKKWKMNNKSQQLRSFVWICERNEVEQAEHVNVLSIIDEEDAQIFEFPYLESSQHQKNVTIESQICGKIQAQHKSPKNP